MAAPAPSGSTRPAPGWVTAALGEDLTDVARLPWGFTNETWAATTSSGERFAVTRMAGPGAAAFVLREGPEIARRVAAVGLVMPVPIPVRSAAADRVVVSSWLDGTPAMLRLRDARGAAEVGRALGDARRRLDAVDVSGLALDGTWARPSSLAIAAEGWLAGLGAAGAGMATAIARRIATVRALPAASRTSFVHGDLVPANLLLRDAAPALLDLEAARIGDPLFDAGWFRWIVAFHHQELEEAAWQAFASEAGLARPSTTDAALLDAYPVLRILEILAGPGLAPGARDRWLRQLEGAVARTPRF